MQHHCDLAAFGDSLTVTRIESYVAEERRRLRAISDQTCSDETIGHWVNELGYVGLVEALTDHEILSVVYPDLKRDFDERHIRISTVEKHWSQCQRCQLVAENHEWADKLLERLLLESSEPVVSANVKRAAASA